MSAPFAATLILAAPSFAQQSVGRCDHDEVLQVHEILPLVTVAPQKSVPFECPGGDGNCDSRLSADELIQAASRGVEAAPAAYDEAGVRARLADAQLGNVIDFYRQLDDAESVETVRRWDAGVRVCNPEAFERTTRCTGTWLVVYAGTCTPIEGMDVFLTSGPEPTATPTPTPTPTSVPTETETETPCPTGTVPACPPGEFAECSGGPDVCSRSCWCETCGPCPEGEEFAPESSRFCRCVPAAPTDTPERPPCPGDCNGNRRVGVNEVIRGVEIALGMASLGACPTFDTNGDGAVAVNELIESVNNALSGCPP